ncbi:RIP metalloprotease RseP [Minwuia sp.]|uniref:RIP metalloprotease RseP n=1 Tax=Minwuia sp. TaxID=2493630 RepID=UPI003A934AE6
MIDVLVNNIFSVIVIMTVLIFIHEMGHYLVARWCGVAVETFSIGFGREVFGWNDRSGTRWRVAWLPFGGYVKFAGDANAASTPDFDRIDAADPTMFQNKPLWQRAAVVFAGPAANFLLAIAIFMTMFLTLGQPHMPARVDKVLPDSPAAVAGLQSGDLIVEANGERIDGFSDLRRVVALNLDRELQLIVERDAQAVSIGLRPEVIEQDDGFGRSSRIGRIGVTPVPEREFRQLGLVAATVEAVEQVWETLTGSLIAIGDMIVGDRSVAELRGPVGIVQLTGEVAELGTVPLINLAAFLSISLGLINLFPIPMLDGGHLLFYAVEAVRGRPLRESTQEIGYRIGLGLVVTLMVVATFNDFEQTWLGTFVGGLFS